MTRFALIPCASATLTLTALVGFPAYASTCSYDYNSPPSPLHSATVDVEKSVFRRGDPSCHDTNNTCIGPTYTRNGSYLVRGDKILILKTVGTYVCASYKRDPNSEEVLGWLNKKDITLNKYINSSIVGSWKGPGGSSALFTQRGNIITGEADATWPAFATGDRAMSVASFKGQVSKKIGFWAYDGGGCKINFFVNFSDMIITDNGSCGGMNARLNGRYKKIKNSR